MEYGFPHTMKSVKALKQNGVKIMLHICGILMIAWRVMSKPASMPSAAMSLYIWALPGK